MIFTAKRRLFRVQRFVRFIAFPAAVAGAKKGTMKAGNMVFLLLLTLGGAATLSAQNPVVDSIRTIIEQGYRNGERNLRWRALTDACVNDPELLEQQLDWAASLGDTAVYHLAFAGGRSLMKTSEPYRSIAYQRRGLDLARHNRDTLGWGNLAQQIGYVYTNLTTQSDSAAHYLYQAISLLEEHYPQEAWSSYYTLSYLQDQLGLSERAVASITKAYQLSKLTGRRMDYGFALFHLLTTSLENEAQDTFNRYWPEYVEFREGAKTVNRQHDALLSFLSDDEDALEQLRGVADRIEAGEYMDPSSVGTLFANLGFAYLARRRYQSAERYFRLGIGHEARIGRVGNQMRFYQDLARLGQASGNAELVAEGLTEVQTLRDSIARKDYQENLSRFEVQYETEKAKAELAESKLALSESLRQRNQLLLGGGGLVLIGLLGFFFYRNRLRLQALETRLERERRKQEVAEANRKAELSSLRSLIEGQETERARVAKDLHDGLGGLLTTVKVHLASNADKEEAEALIDRACTSVRRIAHNMVPQTLAESGLAGSLQDLTAQLRVQGYKVDLEIIGEPDAYLDLHQQAILLRIAQELTHNVVKHAGAKSILLQLVESEGRLLLTVEDDGKGFNLDHAKRTGGLGINSIEQRVAYLEGRILYDSMVGQGTTVTVEV